MIALFAWTYITGALIYSSLMLDEFRKEDVVSGSGGALACIGIALVFWVPLASFTIARSLATWVLAWRRGTRLRATLG